jgi:hypothetical protein
MGTSGWAGRPAERSWPPGAVAPVLEVRTLAYWCVAKAPGPAVPCVPQHTDPVLPVLACAETCRGRGDRVRQRWVHRAAEPALRRRTRANPGNHDESERRMPARTSGERAPVALGGRERALRARLDDRIAKHVAPADILRSRITPRRCNSHADLRSRRRRDAGHAAARSVAHIRESGAAGNPPSGTRPKVMDCDRPRDRFHPPPGWRFPRRHDSGPRASPVRREHPAR